MPSEVEPNRTRLLVGLCLPVATCLIAGVAFAAPPAAKLLAQAVTVGAEAIPTGAVTRGLTQCARHAPELAPSLCLDRYWVPRWLLDAEARDLKLMDAQGSAHAHADILHAQLVKKIAQELPPPSDERINAYLQKNKRDFEKPLRIRIFRILLATKDEAQDLIKKLSPTTSPADFRTLAREHSLDRATNERGGDLGFVWPNGSTDVPQISAETSLYEAALTLEDGAFSKEPVKEGKRYAVIWRRGSLAAREPNDESRKIAAARLIEEQTESVVQDLLKKGKSSVKGRDSMLLGKLRRKEASLFTEP